MKSRVRAVVALLLCLLTSPAVAAVKKGQVAPPLVGTVIGGGAISLQQLRGKVVIVDFWATWCEPCKASLPQYEVLQRRFAARGLVILAVSVDDEAANVQRFVKKHGLSLRVVHDKGGKIAEGFQPPKMPTAYLIGRDGKVRWIHGGYKSGDVAGIEAQIVAALGPATKGVAPPRATPPRATPPRAKRRRTKRRRTKRRRTKPQTTSPHLGAAPGGPAAPATPSAAPVAPAPAAANASGWLQRTRGIMGTRFVILARVHGAQQTAAVDRALDHVAALERVWSPWIAGSDLARLNAAPAKRAVKIARRTTELLVRTAALCEASAGAFDPTFFSLHGLWRLKERPFVPPTEAAIRARLPDVGCRQLRVVPARRTATRLRPGTQVHLGGNAKGTALDEAAALLRRAGLRDFVVDGGGDLVTHGAGPKGAWRVGIKRPRGRRVQVAALLALSHNEAVATSGDYERFVLHKGKRYHHILDPRTGRPVQSTRQVTIVTPDGPHAGERADGLATAVFVLGPKAGLALIARNSGVDALIIDSKGHWHFSPGMRTRLGTTSTL